MLIIYIIYVKSGLYFIYVNLNPMAANYKTDRKQAFHSIICQNIILFVITQHNFYPVFGYIVFQYVLSCQIILVHFYFNLYR